MKFTTFSPINRMHLIKHNIPTVRITNKHSVFTCRLAVHHKNKEKQNRFHTKSRTENQ